MSSQRKGQLRLKLHISKQKYLNWLDYLERTNPYSDFFSNFSCWVRNCLFHLPKNNIVPFYPIKDGTINQKVTRKKDNAVIQIDSSKSNTIIEKTVWLPKEMKQALIREKGHLSINAYTLLILDFSIFGGIDESQRIFQILNMQKKIDILEIKIKNLSDKEYILRKREI
ncbi:MAG: hypothetical protein ACTSVU_05340 [Promethearchaeota archaeon]